MVFHPANTTVPSFGQGKKLAIITVNRHVRLALKVRKNKVDPLYELQAAVCIYIHEDGLQE